MQFKKGLAVLVTSLLLAGGGVTVATSAASATQPDFICQESGEGWGSKIDTTGDPATVTVTADEGKLIDKYCVKAGTTQHIITVDPAAAEVVIDHPEKDSVSHYQVHQINKPKTDTVPAAPQIVQASGSCVEGEWSATSASITLPSNPNGAWLDPQPTQAPAGEYTFGWRAADGFTIPASDAYTVDGNTAYFTFTINAPPVEEDCAPEEEPPVEVNTCQSFGSVHTTDLSTWDLTQTRATGHNELVEDGLRVWTEGATSTDKAAAYFTTSFALKDAGAGFGINLTNAGGGVPGLQLAVDLDNDGDLEGYLVHEPVYGVDTLWLSANWGGADLTAAPTAVNGGGTGKGGHVNAWLAGYPNAQVKAIGYSLGSGVKGDVTITSIVVGCTTYTFDYVAPPTFEPSCTTITGSQFIEGDGVLSVEGDWTTDSIAVPFTGTLADIGTVLDIQADPIQYVGLHIDTAKGTIVFEEEQSYAGKLWSTSAWAGVEAGMGYAAFGSIEEFIHLNGDVAVTGIRLLYTNSVAASTTVESFTIGCTEYTFVPPLPEDTSIPGEWSEPIIDCDSEVGDEVTITREVVLTTYTRGEDGQPVEHTETVTENDVYIVTQEDVDALECEVPVDPTDPVDPVDPTDPVKPAEPQKPATPATPANLAVTGTDGQGAWWLTAGGLMALLVGLIAFAGPKILRKQ